MKFLSAVDGAGCPLGQTLEGLKAAVPSNVVAVTHAVHSLSDKGQHLLNLHCKIAGSSYE